MAEVMKNKPLNVSWGQKEDYTSKLHPWERPLYPLYSLWK